MIAWNSNPQLQMQRGRLNLLGRKLPNTKAGPETSDRNKQTVGGFNRQLNNTTETD